MPKTSSIKLGGRFVGLLIGGQGSGKTVACASFPGPIKIFDFDGRVEPIKRFYPNREDIDYITISAYDPPPGRYDVINFRQFCIEFEDLQKRCDYATVVIDSITSLTATVVRYQLNRKGPNKGKKLADLIDVPTWDEFNGECQAVVDIIEISKVLPCHVIFTAHPVDKTEILKAGNTETVRKTQSITAFGNKTPSFVPNYFNEIYNFHKQNAGDGAEPHRIVTTLAGEEVLCKTALPLPAQFNIAGKPFFKVVTDYLDAYHIKLAATRAELQRVAEEQSAATVVAQGVGDGGS